MQSNWGLYGIGGVFNWRYDVTIPFPFLDSKVYIITKRGLVPDSDIMGQALARADLSMEYIVTRMPNVMSEQISQQMFTFTFYESLQHSKSIP